VINPGDEAMKTTLIGILEDLYARDHSKGNWKALRHARCIQDYDLLAHGVHPTSRHPLNPAQPWRSDYIEAHIEELIQEFINERPEVARYYQEEKS